MHVDDFLQSLDNLNVYKITIETDDYVFNWFSNGKVELISEYHAGNDYETYYMPKGRREIIKEFNKLHAEY